MSGRRFMIATPVLGWGSSNVQHPLGQATLIQVNGPRGPPFPKWWQLAFNSSRLFAGSTRWRAARDNLRGPEPVLVLLTLFTPDFEAVRPYRGFSKRSTN